MSFLELHAGASQVAQWQRTRLPMQGTWVQSLGREDSLERVANIKNTTGNPLQYSCLENPMDRGAWQAAVHGAAKSQTSEVCLGTAW